jgi:ketosteroid isomerase-like protein
MDHEQASRWLGAYVAAWRSNDRAQIEALFTDDAHYRYAPYEQPLLGAAAIADSWLEDPDDPESWEAAYEPVAVEGDTVVAVGLSRYRDSEDRPARTYHNCYLLRFADNGRCRDFTEWFMAAPS